MFDLIIDFLKNDQNKVFVLSLAAILIIVVLFVIASIIYNNKNNTKKDIVEELAENLTEEKEANEILKDKNVEEETEVLSPETEDKELNEADESCEEASNAEIPEEQLTEESKDEEVNEIEETSLASDEKVEENEEEIKPDETEEKTDDVPQKEELTVEENKEETIPSNEPKVEKKPKSTKKSLPLPHEATVVNEPKKRVYKGKYEICSTGDGYAYTLKASNGEILIQSEVYSSKEGVLRAIDAIRRNVETGDIRIFADKRGRYKFKVVSKNYRVLAIGANYQTEKRANSAAESFKKFAINSDIIEVDVIDKDYIAATKIDITTEPKDGGKYCIEKYESEYSWSLKANNGEILCQADGYTSKNGCLFAIEKFKHNVENGEFKYVKDKNGAYCYKLYNQSGRVCAVGESCPTKQGAISQARSVKSFFHTIDIVEIKD